jgi:tetratricopeptide (TPR) repeat protein
MMTRTPRIASWAALAVLAFAVPQLARAQDSALARGAAAMHKHDYLTARRELEQAVRAAPDDYEANWRLAMALVNLGLQTPDDQKSPARDSLYAHAESYARRAVAAKPTGADGHFALGTAVGRASLTVGKKERIKRAAEIYREARNAIDLDARHDGAYHLLGRWHAEIMRLTALQKFFAKTFLGAAIFDQASWDEAEHNLRTAVELDPTRIFHRLDLAEVLVDRERWREAKAEVDTIITMPPVEPMDLNYRRQALALGSQIARKIKP